MKIYEMAAYLSSIMEREEFNPDAEILVEDADGKLWEFTIEETEATFDGFIDYTPEGLKIIPENN